MTDESEKNIKAHWPASRSLPEEIIDTVREPMLVLDATFHVRQANTSFYRHFLVKPEGTIGQRVFDLGNGQWDILRLRELLEKILPENSVFNDFEVQHTFEHIGQRSMLLNARQIGDHGMILLAIEDVTQRKIAALEARDAALEAKDNALEAKDNALEAKDNALEAKDNALEAKDNALEARDAALDASQAKSEFLAHMSHEIRTPMAVFIPAIECLLQTINNPEDRKMLKVADSAAKRLRVLIDNILDFSRIEARQVKLKQEPFAVRASVGSVLEFFTWQARDKGLQLVMDVAADVPHLIVGDSNRLDQVLVNLLGNAIKFTNEGEVSVTVKFREDILEFAVADTGIGIPEGKRHLLFRSFSQVGTLSDHKIVGSGLGLAISKGLVELMGGRIGVHCREKGTTFSFTLPAKVVKASQTIRRVMPTCGYEEIPMPRILVAEDEPLLRQMMTMMLTKRGWNADLTSSGREALERWEQGEYDIILMDLQMPEMDGLETSRAIRNRETRGAKRTCIIGLTAHVGSEIKRDCLKAGMDGVMTKPISMEDLFSTIEHCLSD